MKKKVLLFLLSVLSVNWASSQCTVIYVTPTGTGIGTQSSPSSLSAAMTAASSGDLIRMAEGNYIINNTLQLKNGITLEGGFDPTNNWQKSSLPGKTNIIRNSNNFQGPTLALRCIAVEGINVSNFTIQDITIRTNNASSNGVTNYGVYLRNCSDYYFSRTMIVAGRGGSGVNGRSGSNGLNGQNGFSGTAGDEDDDCPNTLKGRGGAGGRGGGTGAGNGAGSSIRFCNSRKHGTSGSGSTNRRAGGGGGAGGSGGSDNNNGGNGGRGGIPFGMFGPVTITGIGGSSGSSNWGGDDGERGSDGRTGKNGLNGTNGSVGPTGTYASGYFIPGVAAANGQDGQGGQGGSGGGGGGGQNVRWRSSNDGLGSGAGGGGGGGQGGAGGEGGRGGGGSFGVYLHNNGVNGNFMQCNVTTIGGGGGGKGGTGGIGGRGGLRGIGSSFTSNEVGAGAHGGAGGRGGNGGNGGAGANGISTVLRLDGGNVLTSNNINFNLVAQPEVILSDGFCLADSFIYSSSSSAIWNFGSFVSSNPNIPTTNAIANYIIPGRHDVTFGSNNYQGFVYISTGSPSLANAGIDSTVCSSSDVIDLYADSALYGNGTWNVIQGNTSITSPSQHNSMATLSQGLNRLEWVITSSCCSPTRDTVDIYYYIPSTPPTLSHDTINICGSQVANVTVTNGITGTNANWQWYEGGCGSGNSIGSGPNINLTSLNRTWYYVRAEGGHCTTPTTCDSVYVVKGSLSDRPTAIIASNNFICSGEQITLRASGGTLRSGDFWVWYTDTCGGQLIGYGDSITISPIQTTKVYVRAEPGGSCAPSPCTKLDVVVVSPPVTFDVVDTICGTYTPRDLVGGLPLGGYYSGTGVLNNKVYPDQLGRGYHAITYTYRHAPSNCVVSDIGGVFIKPTCDDVTIVNTITPNGDGINDTWLLDLSEFSDPVVTVFNKWGLEVFSSKSQYIDWDATYKGEDVPAGTYYYIVRFGGERKQQSGALTIIR